MTIATDLKDDSTNVEVNTMDELNKFAKFVNYDLYIWDDMFCEWTTYIEQESLGQLEKML